MNIEEFYDQDERRRESEEIELGSEWHDTAGLRYDLSYVVATGELYLMSAPDAEMIEDPFGDIAVDTEPVDALTVDVIAVVPTTDELHLALTGWEESMLQPSSLDWLTSR